MASTITAKTKKTATAAVGTIWEVAVKVTPAPDDLAERPVTIVVDTPTRGHRTVVATPTGDGGYAAAFVLDEPGDFTAVVQVDAEDGADPADPPSLDGFKATATPLPDDPAPEAAPDESEPDSPAPADA